MERIALENQGDLAGALNCHHRAHDVLPDSRNALHFAAALMLADRLEEADRVLRAGLRRDEDSAELRGQLAALLLERNEPQRRSVC